MKRIIVAAVLAASSLTIAPHVVEAAPTGCTITNLVVNGRVNGAKSFCSGGSGWHRPYILCKYGDPIIESYSKTGVWARPGWGSLVYCDYLFHTQYAKAVQTKN